MIMSYGEFDGLQEHVCTRLHTEYQPYKDYLLEPDYLYNHIKIHPLMMVHYVRFLKPPSVQTTGTCHVVKSLITVTNDLRDDLYRGDLTLDAELLISGMEMAKPLLQKRFAWTSGMRILWIMMEGIALDAHLPLRLRISASNALAESSPLKTFPDVLSAWSESFGLGLNNETGERVERRLILTPDNILRIFEESGESIARHIWWVSR